MNLEAFIEQYNENRLDLDVTTEAYSLAVEQSLLKQFQNRREHENRLRVSSLGKYAVIQALNYFGVHEQQSKYRGVQADMFHVGDITEARLITLMKACGLTVTHEQHEVTWNHVLGHTDCVVDDVVIDIKTCNDGNFKRYQRQLPLSYMTQIGVYMEALDLHQCAVLLYNRNTCELALSVPNLGDVQSAVYRAYIIALQVPRLKSVSDIWNYFETPDTVEEVFQKQKTGRYYVPYDVRSPYDELLYETVVDVSGYGNERKYVTRYREPQEVEQLVNNLL